MINKNEDETDLFTHEEVLIYSQYRSELLKKFREFGLLEMSDEKKLFIISTVLIDVLKTLKSVDVSTFLYIIEKLNEGEHSEQNS